MSFAPSPQNITCQASLTGPMAATRAVAGAEAGAVVEAVVGEVGEVGEVCSSGCGWLWASAMAGKGQDSRGGFMSSETARVGVGRGWREGGERRRRG